MPQSYNCWKCRMAFSMPSSEKVPFRATCEKCGAWLHVCKQCRHHAFGKPNQCNVPGTDYIADREMANYCEEFSPKTVDEPKQTSSRKDAERKLFGDPSDSADLPLNKEERFLKLFKDQKEEKNS